MEDLESDHARHRREGFTVTDLKTLKRGEDVLARFFFATDPDGYRIEVIQRGGRFS